MSREIQLHFCLRCSLSYQCIAELASLTTHRSDGHHQGCRRVEGAPPCVPDEAAACKCVCGSGRGEGGIHLRRATNALSPRASCVSSSISWIRRHASSCQSALGKCLITVSTCLSVANTFPNFSSIWPIGGMLISSSLTGYGGSRGASDW